MLVSKTLGATKTLVCPPNVGPVPAACDDSCTGVLLDDLEDVDGRLSTVNVSSLVVASYLQLAELEKQSRQLQVTAQHRPLLETQQRSMTLASVDAGVGGRWRRWTRVCVDAGVC